MGFPCGSASKEFACNMGDLGSIPGLGRSPGEGKGYPLQYSGLENFLDCVVRGVAESDMTERLSLYNVDSLAKNCLTCRMGLRPIKDICIVYEQHLLLQYFVNIILQVYIHVYAIFSYNKM